MSSSTMRPTDAFATHQQFLKEYIVATTGDIIEFGTGWGSTPLILDLIRGTGRRLVSVESVPDWLNTMKANFPPSDQHEYVFVSNWDEDIKTIKPMDRFSVCFVDSAPWSSRQLAMKYFENRSDYVIIHDADYFPVHGCFGKVLGPHSFDFSDIARHGKWKMYYPATPWPSSTGPPTLVYTKSDFAPIL